MNGQFLATVVGWFLETSVISKRLLHFAPLQSRWQGVGRNRGVSGVGVELGFE